MYYAIPLLVGLLVGALFAFIDPGAVPAVLVVLMSAWIVYLILED